MRCFGAVTPAFRGADRAQIVLVLDSPWKQGRKPTPPPQQKPRTKDDGAASATTATPWPLKPGERDVECLEHKIRIGVGNAHGRLNAERIPE